MVQRVSADMTPPGIPGIPNQIPEFRSWIVHRSLSWEVRAKEPCGQSRIEIRESDSGFRGFWEGSCLRLYEELADKEIEMEDMKLQLKSLQVMPLYVLSLYVRAYM